MNLYERAQIRREQMILAKLRDMGVPLDSPDETLRQALAEVVMPDMCYHLARAMRERMREGRAVQERLC